jgi:capsular polysaccharide biosynthesis protein
MRHTCHAKKCLVEVPPKMFMCKRHWYRLPKRMRDKVWELYVPGQEVTKTPSPEYLAHTAECIRFVWARERAES